MPTLRNLQVDFDRMLQAATTLVLSGAILFAIALWTARQADLPMFEMLISNTDGRAGQVLLVFVVLSAPLWFRGRSESQSRPQLRSLLRAAVCCALATALVLIAVRWVLYATTFRALPVTFSDYFATLPSMTYWLVPAGQLLAFGAAALWVAAVGSSIVGRSVERLAVFLFSFLAAMEVFGLAGGTRIHAGSIVLLSLGAALTTLRWHVAHPVRMPKVGFGLLVGTTAAVAISAVGRERWADRAQGPGSVPSTTRPNVLLITLDTVRKQNLSGYGYSRGTTPNLDRFAERGVTFTAAFNASSWTLPSHASMFTGLPARVHRADYFQPLTSEPRTLAEELTKAGYAAAGFVGNCSYCSARTGLARGFAHYDDLPLRPLVLLKTSRLLEAFGGLLFGWQVHDPRQTAEEVNDALLNWLSKPRQPFFAFVNYYDAHFPYFVPDHRFRKKYTPNQDSATRQKFLTAWSKSPHDWAPTDPVEIEFAIDSYDECIAYIDYHLGRLLATLEAWGILDNTLVIVVNDHGEHFGEHGQWLHGSTVYRQLIESPLIVVWPGHLPSGTKVDEPVSLVDLPATIQEMVGTSEAPLPGRSWAGLCTGDTRRTSALLAEVNLTVPTRRPLWASCLVANGLHYVRWGDEGDQLYGEELYDLHSDPLDSVNLVATPEGERQLPELRNLFDSFRRQEAATRENAYKPRRNRPAGNPFVR